MNREQFQSIRENSPRTNKGNHLAITGKVNGPAHSGCWTLIVVHSFLAKGPENHLFSMHKKIGAVLGKEKAASDRSHFQIKGKKKHCLFELSTE